jgi:hypothetical protein
MTEIPRTAESGTARSRTVADTTHAHTTRRHHTPETSPAAAHAGHAGDPVSSGGTDTRRWRYGSAVEAARRLASGGGR